MASFKGATFSERGQGAQTFETFGREADVQVIRIPGGNTNVIQSSGIAADRLNLRIRGTKSEMDALRNLVNTSGSLVYSYGTRNAFLQAISDPQEVLASGLYFATLQFIGM